LGRFVITHSPAAKIDQLSHGLLAVKDGYSRSSGCISPMHMIQDAQVAGRPGGGLRSRTSASSKGGKITLAYPDEYLEGLADKLQTANVSHLPVVSRDAARLVGYVGWKDLMRVRSKTRAEEQDRARFFRVAGRNVPRNG